MSNDALTVGLIGLDTSHVSHFTRLLNNTSEKHHVAGGRVVAAYPGGSPDFDKSWSRVEGFTNELRDDYGIAILDSPEAVAQQVDLVFIESVDGRVHLEQLKQTVSHKRPTYIDKPIALCSSDVLEMKRIAQEAGIPLMSSSALRYSENLIHLLEAGQDDGPIVGCDVYGPMMEEPLQPGLFWYGIHCVEILVTVMGVGFESVHVVRNDNTDLVVVEWPDGRLGTIRGSRTEHSQFGLTVHRGAGPRHANLSITTGKPYYASLLEAIMRSLPYGRSALPIEETIEVVRLIESANESRQSGSRVDLSPALLSE